MSPTGTAESTVTASRTRTNRSANPTTVDSSNKSVAYVNCTDNPADTPCSSTDSMTVTCKSNFATAASNSTPEIDNPGNSNVL
ncbi:hypothetical protein MLGJGCBP_03136 [Rhodococcus sp. T7]|nr:hypothetical protein MLGJGCBP_03136 [Rhodococcus sp. T7]